MYNLKIVAYFLIGHLLSFLTDKSFQNIFQNFYLCILFSSFLMCSSLDRVRLPRSVISGNTRKTQAIYWKLTVALCSRSNINISFSISITLYILF